MKMYEKPEAKVIEVSEEDIIQTSNNDLIIGDGDDNKGFIEFSLDANNVKSDALFKN